ncbi:MAG: hypothetical protein SW019_07080 [Actinomycetota bacterium]|nr:hypothetical protein [Actinomycetota bacterium]
MTDSSDGEHGSGARAHAHRRSRQSPGWVAPLALAVALVAAVASVWALTSGPGEQSAERAVPQPQAGIAGDGEAVIAAADLCRAADRVSRAVQLQTHRDLGPEPVAQTAVAASAGLALLGGGLYLEGQLPERETSDLSDTVGQFASVLQDIGASSLAGVTNQDPAQQKRLREGDRLRQEIAGLCA